MGLLRIPDDLPPGTNHVSVTYAHGVSAVFVNGSRWPTATEEDGD